MLGVEDARFFRVLDQQRQLIDRVDHLLAGRRLVAEEPQDAVGGQVDDPDERPAEHHKNLKRPGHQQRRPVRRLQRQRLRNQLAEDDMHEGDEGEREADGDRVIGPGAPTRDQPVEQRRDQAGQGRLAHPAEGDAGQRDAQLRSGDGLVELVHHAGERLGARHALRD